MGEFHALIKVTIVGYYKVSSGEIDNYGIDEFDPNKMAEIDYLVMHDDPASLGDIVTDWFLDGKPTSVTFEVVDMDVPEC